MFRLSFNITLFAASVFIVTLVACSFRAHASCSPGIPCTEYNIYDNLDAGTSADYNGPKTGLPSPYDTGACDGNFMNQIYSNAYMHAEREILMSEQLIHKPDSVLEYTCFDKYLTIAAHKAGSIFSETSHWDGELLEHRVYLWTGDDIFTYVTMDVTYPDYEDYFTAVDYQISQLINSSLRAYIEGSFSHTYLGEASILDSSIEADDIEKEEYLGDGSYHCSEMETVWLVAKCADFAEDDRFRTFEDLLEGDPRSIPAECSVGHSFDDDTIIEAGEDDTKLESTSPVLVEDLTDPLSDPMDSNDLMYNPCPALAYTGSGWGWAWGGSAGPPTDPWWDWHNSLDVKTDYFSDFIRLANNCDLDEDHPDSYASIDLMQLFGEWILGVQNPEGHYIEGTENIYDGIGGDEISIVECHIPIPTGVPVVTYNYTPIVDSSTGYHSVNMETLIHYEHICTNPGCYYVPEKVPYVINTAIPDSTPLGECVPY